MGRKGATDAAGAAYFLILAFFTSFDLGSAGAADLLQARPCIDVFGDGTEEGAVKNCSSRKIFRMQHHAGVEAAPCIDVWILDECTAGGGGIFIFQKPFQSGNVSDSIVP